MLTRSFVQHDQRRLTELTIETFRPFYEESFVLSLATSSSPTNTALARRLPGAGPRAP